MARLLRQSTAFTFRAGPFVDSTDGATAETGLTIAQADLQISKDGGAFAQTSAIPTTTHDTDGWYQCPLTATDTNTLGPLTVQITVSGALPVWHDFLVVPANVYDSLVDGTDDLDVQVAGIDANAITATSIASNALTAAKIATDAITSAKIAANALGASELAADAATEIATAVWAATTRVLTAGTNLNDLSAAQVNAEVDTALADYDGPTNAEMVARTLVAAAYFDPTTDQVDADVVAISGDTTAADRLEALLDGIIVGQVNDGSATTTAFIADGFTEATDDHFNGRLVTFISGTLSGQQTDITDYTGSTQSFTVTALTEAPANDDFFVIH